jgi:hypothetical protein
VTVRAIWIFPVLFSAVSTAAYTDLASCQQKFDLIESGRLRAGSHVELSSGELNAWAAAAAPSGVRDPRLALTSPGLATGTALVDFGKIRRAQGYHPGWLMSKLLDGERPVSVTARIRSDFGRATVDVLRVEISGIAIDGRTLDFVIQNFLLALYPNAAVGRPFELGHNIRKLDVEPRAVSVYIGR